MSYTSISERYAVGLAVRRPESNRSRKLNALESRPPARRRAHWFSMTRTGRMSWADWFSTKVR